MQWFQWSSLQLLLWIINGYTYENNSWSTATSYTACSTLAGCVQCLRMVGCGWCSLADSGWCENVDQIGQNSTNICNARKSDSNGSRGVSEDTIWLVESCPIENECQTGKHNCDQTSEQCMDTKDGFECWCKDGYERKNDRCMLMCHGCVNGTCVESNVCQCHLGFVGSNCEYACNCNGHSTCPGPENLDRCLQCYKSTKGAHCELCETGYLRKANSCVTCRDYCYNHSDVCVNARIYNKIQAFVTAPPNISLVSQLTDEPNMEDQLNSDAVGPSSVPAICLNCSDYTKGLQCEYCQSGYFRPPKSPPWMPCMRCKCNGHSVDNVCNPQRGDGCQCQNNTLTPHSCKDDDCWSVQCSTCRDGFRGTPVNGRQCYWELTEPDQAACFVSDESCRSMSSRPLGPMELSFFVVTPAFSNVDVRIIVDVGQGAVDAFLSVSDVFVTHYNPDSACNILRWDADAQIVISSRQRIFLDEIEDCAPGKHSNWALVDMKDAGKRLSTYKTYGSPSSVLVLHNVQNRVVIIARSRVFDLKSTRFYIVIRSRASAWNGTIGNVLYIQDPTHFDLFIFFTVFFAVFFLVMGGALVVWRVKIACLEHRHVQAQTMELMKLAKRPLAKFNLIYDQVYTCSSNQTDGYETWPICLQNLRRKPLTVATFVIRMPGGTRAPVKLALASALFSTSPAAKVQKFQDGRSGQTNAAQSNKTHRSKMNWISPVRYRVQPC